MMKNRILPPLYFEKSGKVYPTTSREGIPDKTWEKMSDDQKLGHVKDPDEIEDKETQFVNRRARTKKSEGIEMTRPYTMDEITTAQLLKGHPQAQEIVDTFFKSKKKTEGGEEFQDGSEDSIGKEGHAAPARPGTIKHEGGNPVPGPNHPGTAAKNASIEDEDLQKANKYRKEKSHSKVLNPRRVNLGHSDQPLGIKTHKEVAIQHGDRSKEPTTDRWHAKTSVYDKGGEHEGKVTNMVADSYKYDKEKGDIRVRRAGEERHKRIPANAAHEKELKNASLHATLDEILDDDLQKSINIVGDFLIEKGYDLDETNEIIEDYFGFEKSGVERGTLTDNEPNEFKDGIEDDDTIPEGEEGEGETAEEAQVGKSFTQDESTLEHLRKTMGAERFEELMKAVIPKYTQPGALSSRVNAPSEKETASNPLINRRANPEKIAALTQKLQSGTKKSEDDFDLEKSEEGEEQMEKDYSLEFSEDILKAMGLYKGSPSVSKKVSGGKATQILYGSEHEGEVGKRGKPETRYEHPKSKVSKRTRFEPTKGEVTVRTREKGNKEAEWKDRKIGAGEEEKLKNASTSSSDLHKALDEILAKRG
jgi:hypothetical protein